MVLQLANAPGEARRMVLQLAAASASLRLREKRPFSPAFPAGLFFGPTGKSSPAIYLFAFFPVSIKAESRIFAALSKDV